jgi:hypothetical protein
LAPLPPRPEPTPRQQARLISRAKCLTYSQAFGHRATRSQFRCLMQRMTRDDWLEKLSVLSMFVANDGVFAPRLHQWLAATLLPDAALDHIQSLPPEEQRITYVLAEQQLLSLFKFVLTLAPQAASGGLDDRDVSHTVGLAALIAMDEAAEAEILALGSAGEALTGEGAASDSVRGLSFAHHERFDRLLDRCYRLFLRDLDGKSWHAGDREYDISKAFAESAKGRLSLAEFFSAGAALRANYMGVSALTPGGPRAGFNRNLYAAFSNTSLSRTKVASILRLVAQPPNAAVRQLAHEEQQVGFGPLSFSAFRRRPVLALAADASLPVSLRFLEERVASGIFWDVFDHMKHVGGLEAAEAFAQVFGGVLQSYAGALVAKAFEPFPAATLNGRRGVPD